MKENQIYYNLSYLSQAYDQQQANNRQLQKQDGKDLPPNQTFEDTEKMLNRQPSLPKLRQFFFSSKRRSKKIQLSENEQDDQFNLNSKSSKCSQKQFRIKDQKYLPEKWILQYLAQLRTKKQKFDAKLMHQYQGDCSFKLDQDLNFAADSPLNHHQIPKKDFKVPEVLSSLTKNRDQSKWRETNNKLRKTNGGLGFFIDQKNQGTQLEGNIFMPQDLIQKCQQSIDPKINCQQLSKLTKYIHRQAKPLMNKFYNIWIEEKEKELAESTTQEQKQQIQSAINELKEQKEKIKKQSKQWICIFGGFQDTKKCFKEKFNRLVARLQLFKLLKSNQFYQNILISDSLPSTKYKVLRNRHVIPYIALYPPHYLENDPFSKIHQQFFRGFETSKFQNQYQE